MLSEARWTQTDRLFVQLTGPMNRETVPDLRKKLLKMAKNGGGKSLVVDFSGVSAADTAGVALLVELLRAIRHSGGRLVLTGVGENVMRMIHLARLDYYFDTTMMTLTGYGQ